MTTIKKFKLKHLIFVLTILLLLSVASSCSLFGNNGEQKVAPKIDAESLPRFQRIVPDYVNAEGKEDYYVDPDPEAIMPVQSGEKVYLIIDYINKSNLPINKVVVTGGGKEVEAASRDFEDGSNSNRTKIEFTIDEVGSEKIVTYTITKIYYNLGSQVLLMNLKTEDMELKVNVNPTIKVKFDHQNADIRTGTPKTTSEKELSYYSSLKDIIPSISELANHENAPIKEGGWSFRGYYTEPNGQGRQMKSTDNLYFWQDVILYAYFERLYNFTVSNAEEPIPYEENGVTKYYTEVASITEKTTAGGEQITLEIYDTIADDFGVYPIVAIESGAFDYTFNLITLKLGKYLKYIGVGAFASSDVTNVQFHPEGCLEVIDDQAFVGAGKLGTGSAGFTLPHTVRYLGDRCFEKSGWGKMIADNQPLPQSKLVIYDNIEHIGDWCFAETKFEEIIFMPGVKFKADAIKGEKYTQKIGEETVTADYDYYLGWCLFKNCEKIKRFRTLADDGQENGLEVLSDGMFDIRYYNAQSNIGLIQVELSEGLKKIGKGTFHYQKLLQSIVLPDTLEDICGYNEYYGSGKVFEGTRNEKSEHGAFAECHALTNIEFKTENSQLKIIGCKAFYNNKALTSITFKSKVFELYGDGPFEGCEKLREVIFEFNDSENIPQPLEGSQRTVLLIRRKGADLFYPSQKFKVFVEDEVVTGFRDSLKLYAHASMIDSMPVYGQGMIKELWDGQTLLGKIALETTQDILHPTEQGWLLGYYFGDTEEIWLPDEFEGKRIVTIGSYAFNENTKKIQLPSYVSLIANYAFNNLTKLSEVVFGRKLGEEQVGINNLKMIGQQAFYKTSITSFVGGHNLDTIGDQAFWSCLDLEWVDLKNTKLSDKLGAGAFWQCRNLKYVRLPQTYRYMHDSTFAECQGLRYIVFENPSPEDGEHGLFSTPAGAYFQGIGEGVITCYVPSVLVGETYNNLEFLPRQLKNSFQYDSQNMSPDPEDLLPNLAG